MGLKKKFPYYSTRASGHEMGLSLKVEFKKKIDKTGNEYTHHTIRWLSKNSISSRNFTPEVRIYKRKQESKKKKKENTLSTKKPTKKAIKKKR